LIEEGIAEGQAVVEEAVNGGLPSQTIRAKEGA
jgi:hypothetical protein